MTADTRSNMNGAYTRLEEIFRRRALIGEAVGVLGWDRSVIMPPGGAAARAEQMATLRVMAHELVADPHVAEADAPRGQGLAAEGLGEPVVTAPAADRAQRAGRIEGLEDDTRVVGEPAHHRGVEDHLIPDPVRVE